MSESFKDLFEAGSQQAPSGASVRVGDRVEGVVSHVGPTSVFVDLNGKSQAYFDVVDVAGPDGKPTLAVGEKVVAVVIEVEPRSGQIRLARRFGKEAGVEQLKVALEQGFPVEGKVVGVNKGGVSVEVGGVRGFCPISQLDDALRAGRERVPAAGARVPRAGDPRRSRRRALAPPASRGARRARRSKARSHASRVGRVIRAASRSSATSARSSISAASKASIPLPRALARSRREGRGRGRARRRRRGRGDRAAIEPTRRAASA